MSTAATPQLDEKQAHKHFAVSCFNAIWPLLEKGANRSESENRAMVHLAHASYYHWTQVGEPVHFQRGKWMLARVYTVLADKIQALYYAQQCLALTEKHHLKDFDLAYAYEAMARAYALNGDESNFKDYYHLAEEAAKAIAGEKDRELFSNDLAAQPWFGMK